jgi:hypothetical protein
VIVVFTLAAIKKKIGINETIQKHSTNNTKLSKYKYTYYQNTHIYTYPHITKPAKTTTVQVTTIRVQDIPK